MKVCLLILSISALVSACNSNPKTVEPATLLKSDSSFVLQPELPAPPPMIAATASVPEKKKVATRNPQVSNSSTGSSTSSSESSNTAAKKKGWSKTAKGAVIGGVVGAGTGAIVNKRNRGAGAVIGGVLGAGTGAIIGNQMDKKDGRH